MRESRHRHDDEFVRKELAKGDSCGRRYLAVLDVLGAKSLSDLHDVEYTALIMKELLRNVELFARNDNINPESTSPIRFIMYADSVLLWSERSAPDGLMDIIKQTGQLLGFAMARGIPLRGAVTVGDLYVSRDRHIMTGPGIVCAYELERKQKWAGAILDPALPNGSGDERLAIDYGLWAHWIKPYRVPMASGKEDHLAVDWCGSIHGQDAEGFRRRFKGTVGRDNPDGVAKQEATLEFWRDATDSQEVFELREAARLRLEAHFKTTGAWSSFTPEFQGLLSAPTSFLAVDGIRGPVSAKRT